MNRLAELRLLAEALRRTRPDYEDPPEVVAERDEERPGWLLLQAQAAALS